MSLPASPYNQVGEVAADKRVIAIAAIHYGWTIGAVQGVVAIAAVDRAGAITAVEVVVPVVAINLRHAIARVVDEVISVAAMNKDARRNIAVNDELIFVVAKVGDDMVHPENSS